METIRVPLDLLVLDPDNARLHPERNLAAIKSSLQRFGQRLPLVVHGPTSIVVGGNGTLQAMKSMGWTECDVAIFDGTMEEARALSLALNRTAELAEWDYQKLGEVLGQMSQPDFEALGWQDFEVSPMVAADWSPPPPTNIAPEAFNRIDPTVRFTLEQWPQVRTVLDQVRAEFGLGSDAEAVVAMCQAWSDDVDG